MQPAGSGQMDDEVQVTDDDVEELAVPSGAGDLPTVQGGGRRVEGLHRADGGHVDPLDAVTDDTLAQVRGERLDLRQLGHGPTVPSVITARLRARSGASPPHDDAPLRRTSPRGPRNGPGGPTMLTRCRLGQTDGWRLVG